MTKVMNESAQMAQEAGITENEMNTSLDSKERNTVPSISSLNASATPDFVVTNEDMGEKEGVSMTKNVGNRMPNKKLNAPSTAVSLKNGSAPIAQEAEEQAALYSPGPSLASPPSTNGDQEIIAEPASVKKGGSLYAAMSQSAYTLAAPAALLATAALIMKRKTRKVHFKRSTRRHTRRHVRRG